MKRSLFVVFLFLTSLIFSQENVTNKNLVSQQNVKSKSLAQNLYIKNTSKKVADLSNNVPSFQDLMKRQFKLINKPQNKQNSSSGINRISKKQEPQIQKLSLPTFKELSKKHPQKTFNLTTKTSEISDIIIVNFPDSKLEARIREALGGYLGELTNVKLQDLTQLYAGWSKITDISGIEYCSNLQWLDLQGNSISDFSKLSGLTNLYALSISNNNSVIQDFSFLNNLTNLGSLYLPSTGINDISFLQNYKNINSLDLSSNPIQDFTPLSGLTTITILGLENLGLKNVNFLGNMTNLINLTVSSNQISDISLIANFTNLISLELSENPISDFSPISGLTNLTFLEINNAGFDDSKTNTIANSTTLQQLFLENNNITNISFLNKLVNISTLSLCNNPINYGDAENIFQDLTRVETLLLNQTGLKSLDFVKNMSNLYAIIACYDNIVNITPLLSLAKLQILNVWGNPITNKAVLIDIPQLENKGVSCAYQTVRNLQVLTPSISSDIVIGSPLNITWKNEECEFDACCGGATHLNIDLSTDNGITWTNIVQNTENDGVYEWLVPDLHSTNCIIKISDSEVPDLVNDITDDIFSIPQQEIIVHFNDINLEAKIREALGGFQGNLTPTKLKELTNLWVSYSNISDLSGIEYCTNLFSLSLSGNNISDFSKLSNLKNLYGLEISNIGVPISDFSFLTELPNLHSFFAENNGITNISFLQNLVQLTSLALAYNNISDFTPLSLLNNVEFLGLDYTGFKDLNLIQQMVKLNFLGITNNQVSDISVLSNFPNLSILNMGDNPIADFTPLTSLTNLTCLNIYNVGLDDSNTNVLADKINLNQLLIYGNKISDLSFLKNLVNLGSLFMFDNPINYTNSKSIFQNLVKLEILVLDNTGLSDLTTLESLVNLTGLFVSYNNISNIDPLLNFSKLQSLRLNHNPFSNKVIMIDIPKLVNRGVLCSYDQQIYLALLEPNRTSKIIKGANFDIKWKNEEAQWYNISTGAVNVNLDLSTDGGTTWSNIVKNTKNDSSYTWKVPNINSNNCLIKISDSDVPDLVFDYSDSTFSIPQSISAAAQISVSPEGLNFGRIELGSDSNKTFIIKNIGTDSLFISLVGISGTSSSEFNLSGINTPFSIAPGDSHSVNIKFKPASAPLSIKEAFAYLISNDPLNDTTKISLTGYGIPKNISDYALLADKEIKINNCSLANGNIHSNKSIEIVKGSQTPFNGSITAVKDISIKSTNQINGDVICGGNLSTAKGVNISGLSLDKTPVTAITLPSLSYKAGKQDIKVKKGDTLSLNPGSYGQVIINGTCKMTSGDYYFQSLILNDNSKLSVNVNNGITFINVVEKIEFNKFSKIATLPYGNSLSRWLNINFIGKSDVKVENSSFISGLICAPNSKIIFGSDTYLFGQVSAKEIETQNRFAFSFQNNVDDFNTGLAKGNNDSVYFAKINQMVVTEYHLLQNYPNPFNPTTTINYQVPELCHVEIRIYDMLGREVAELVNTEQSSGEYSVQFNASNLCSGTYIYRIVANNYVETRKMLLIK